jgi:hypothetical protein
VILKSSFQNSSQEKKREKKEKIEKKKKEKEKNINIQPCSSLFLLFIMKLEQSFSFIPVQHLTTFSFLGYLSDSSYILFS